MKVKLLDKEIVKLENGKLLVSEDVLFYEDDFELAFAKFRFLYDFIDIPGKKIIDIDDYIKKMNERELNQRAINELIKGKYIEVIE